MTTKHSLGVRVALTENQGTGEYAHGFLCVALSLWILSCTRCSEWDCWLEGDRWPSGSSHSTACSLTHCPSDKGPCTQDPGVYTGRMGQLGTPSRGSFPLVCWSPAATSQCQCLRTLTNCLRVPSVRTRGRTMSTVTKREDMSHNSPKLEVTIGMKLDVSLMSRLLWPRPMCRERETPVLF